MYRLRLIIVFLLMTNLIFGQFTISGKVTGSDQVPIEFAIVSISKGEVMLDHVITDSLGAYQFNDLEAGEYSCLFQYVAYVDTTLTVQLTSNQTLNMAYEGSTLAELCSKTAVPYQRPVM